MNIMKQLPTVALRGLTILPGMVAHFDVSREKSIRAVAEDGEAVREAWAREKSLCAQGKDGRAGNLFVDPEKPGG